MYAICLFNVHSVYLLKTLSIILLCYVLTINSKFQANIEHLCQVIIRAVFALHSIDFDKDQEFFAVGGVTRQLKVYDYNTVITRPVSVHYPIQDLTCASKIRYYT